MNLYVYDISSKEILLEIENVVNYTENKVVTEEGTVYAPFVDDVEFSSLPDCSEALRKNPPDNRPLDEIRADKLVELSASCNDAITAGMDVETTQGVEHFSLQETDQINLTTALSAIQNGSTGYPYHADGQLCRLFSAKEIQDIAEASIKHKLYHTTLCNHLMARVRRVEDKKELADIKYSIENLPQDLKQNMIDILEKTV